jgi:hypothetical protein
MVALIGTNDEHSSRELLRSQIETVEDLEVRIEVADRLLEYKFLTTENGARYSSPTRLADWPKNRTPACKEGLLVPVERLTPNRWCLASGNRLGREVF